VYRGGGGDQDVSVTMWLASLTGLAPEFCCLAESFSSKRFDVAVRSKSDEVFDLLEGLFFEQASLDFKPSEFGEDESLVFAQIIGSPLVNEWTALPENFGEDVCVE